MNTILQKRIEEAAKKYAAKIEEQNPNSEAYNIDGNFITGATFALQNQWISVEEDLPPYDKDVFVRFISRLPNNTDEFEVGYCTRWRTLDESIKTDSKGFSIVGNMEITHWMKIPQLEGGEE